MKTTGTNNDDTAPRATTALGVVVFILGSPLVLAVVALNLLLRVFVKLVRFCLRH